MGSVNTEVVDGITYIHNPEIPLHPERTVTFQEDLSIQAEDEDGNIILYQPYRYVVDANDNIYISDGREQIIKMFDKESNYIKTIGAKGEGPGEFQRAGEMCLLPDGRTFYAYDIFNSEDGSYETRIWSDVQPGLFQRAKMYHLYRDEETGFRSLKRYRVIWSK